MGSLGGFAGWVAGWLGASGWVAGLVAWWLAGWLAGWVAGWVTGFVAWCLGCWLGGFGAWADWGSAGLGLGWVGRGRLAARLDWAWTWAEWGSAGLGSVDIYLNLGICLGCKIQVSDLASFVDVIDVHVYFWCHSLVLIFYHIA